MSSSDPNGGGQNDNTDGLGGNSLTQGFGNNSELSMPAIGDAELGALHIRVIALESLLIAILADASDRQLQLARDMARYIVPREGATPHPLTIHAGAHITDLIDRSARFAGSELARG